jgi:hypothetical protein
LLYTRLMTTRNEAALALAATVLTALLSGCTGGSETNAAEETQPSREAPAGTAATQVDAERVLGTINPAIPLYAGATYRDDLTRRDQVMIRNRYGAGAEVYTLATDDSYPQVFHYYTTYLAQFRGFPAQDTYPPERKDWRTLEVQLNTAMQDPFIPGRALDLRGKQVTLQIAETEAEPPTVIRYIVTPAPPAAVATAAAEPQTAPVAR